MRRSSVVACLMLAAMISFGALSMAQVEFGVGPIVGVNFGSGSISGSTEGECTFFMLGAQGEIGFAKMFYVVVQPTYIEKGFKFEQGESTTVILDEIELPVLFKVKVLDGMFRPYAFAGPNISFILSATQRFTPLSIPDPITQIYSTDFAIDFGGGADLSVTSKVGITADVRYSLGLANTVQWLSDNLGRPPGTPSTITKVSGFQVLVGAMFNIM